MKQETTHWEWSLISSIWELDLDCELGIKAINQINFNLC